jgi:hypothetical protein
MIGNTLSVPSSDDPLAALIETELRPLARVLARLIASELRLLLIQPTSLPQPNGDGPPCHVWRTSGAGWSSHLPSLPTTRAGT